MKGTDNQGRSAAQIIEQSISDGGSGGSSDLTNYYTKTQTNNTFATKSELIANYPTTAYVDSQFADYRTADAQDIASETLINQALTTAASQYIEVIYSTQISGFPVNGSLVPLTQNQISANGAGVFSIVGGNKIQVSQAYGVEIEMVVEFSENNGNTQRIQLTPSWVAGDDLIYQNDNAGADTQPGILSKQWIVSTTALQQLSFAITLLEINDPLDEYVHIKILFKTVSYNSALFVPASNINISNVNNLQLELNSRYIKGQALDMQTQAISGVGGILLDEGTRITDPDFAINAPVNYNNEHMVPKTIIQQMIDAVVESNGGASSILSTLGNTTFTVQDSPSILGYLEANNASILELAIPGGQSVWNAGSLLFTTTNNTKHILYDDIANFSSASQYALCPKAYVDSVISGFGDLSNKISYTTDVTATLTSDFDIVNKDYVDTAVANAGAGFDTANAPLLRYDAGIDSLVVGSDNQNLASVQWVIDNTITGAPQLIERLNQLGNTTYTLSIDNNGRLSYKDTTPKTWWTVDTDASQVMQLNCDLEIQNNYEIIGPSAVSLVTPHAAFADYANTEVVTKEHLQDYIDSVVASGSSNAIVSTSNALNKLVQSGNLTDVELIHTQYEQNLAIQTDTMVCSADSADGNKIKYNFKNSWLKNEQDLATVQAQTDPQIIPTKEYVDSLVMPKVSNRKINSTANNIYSIWTVNHGLNLPLSDLVVQFYVVLTTAKGNHPVGTIFQMHELSYVGNTATDSYGWVVFSIAGDNNNIKVKMLTAGYGGVANATTGAIISIEYNEADLYCNIISIGNNLISQVQTSIQTTNFALSEDNTNLILKNANTNVQMAFWNQSQDARFSSDFVEFCPVAGISANDPSVYLTFQSEDVSPNCLIVRNAATDGDRIRLLYNGTVQAAAFQVIVLSSMLYKNSVSFSTHYDDFLENAKFNCVWFKYKQEIREQFCLQDEPQPGYIWEQVQQIDPENKYKMYSKQMMKDKNKQEHEMCTVDNQRVQFIQVAWLTYHLDKANAKISKLESVLKTVLSRLDQLESDHAKPDIMNQTFDSSTTLKSKLGTGLRKITAKQITLK